MAARAGATSVPTRQRYTLGDADVGNVVRVTVSYIDGHGTAESVTSAQTATIANVNDAPVATDDVADVDEGGTVSIPVLATMRMRTGCSMLPASNSSPVLPTAPSRSARMGGVPISA